MPHGAQNLFFFAGDPRSESIHARIFAPGLGVDEVTRIGAVIAGT
jgi:hypothetical protein